jgi:hypothetical protein
MEKLETDINAAGLDADLASVSDPAVRAFLELRKISKGK